MEDNLLIVPFCHLDPLRNYPLRAALLRLKSALTDGKQITEGCEDEKCLSPLERRYEAKGKDGAATIHPSRLFRVS